MEELFDEELNRLPGVTFPFESWNQDEQRVPKLFQSLSLHVGGNLDVYNNADNIAREYAKGKQIEQMVKILEKDDTNLTKNAGLMKALKLLQNYEERYGYGMIDELSENENYQHPKRGVLMNKLGMDYDEFDEFVEELQKVWKEKSDEWRKGYNNNFQEFLELNIQARSEY